MHKFRIETLSSFFNNHFHLRPKILDFPARHAFGNNYAAIFFNKSS